MLFKVKINGAYPREYVCLGRRYIEGRRNSVYTLYFHNTSNSRVLVVPSVDGLSVIDGKPASYSSRGYVVKPFCSLEIPGWTINSSTIASFVFQPKGDRDNPTYVESLKEVGIDVDVSNAGIIGCAVFKEKKPQVYRDSELYPYVDDWMWYVKGGPSLPETPMCGPKYDYRTYSNTLSMGSPPQSYGGLVGQGSTFVDAIAASSSVSNPLDMIGGTLSPTLGTGMGNDQHFSTTQVEFVREDNPAYTFEIEYDTLTSLERRGIVAKSVPRAFPGNYNAGCVDTRKNKY